MVRSPLAAVFDCDGLLVDSAACWEGAYARIASEHGRAFADVRLDRLLGASVAGAAALLADDLGAAVAAHELRAALGERFASQPPPALPGARELIAALAERIPLAVASNGPRELVTTVLEQLGVRASFAAVVSAEEVPRGKPEPDVYLEACRRLGVAPGDAVAFEDSPLGACAARAAGLVVVAVPSAPPPAPRLDADLTVPRLDDPRLLRFLDLSTAAPEVSAPAG